MQKLIDLADDGADVLASTRVGTGLLLVFMVPAAIACLVVGLGYNLYFNLRHGGRRD